MPICCAATVLGTGVYFLTAAVFTTLSTVVIVAMKALSKLPPFLSNINIQGRLKEILKGCHELLKEKLRLITGMIATLLHACEILRRQISSYFPMSCCK